MDQRTLLDLDLSNLEPGELRLKPQVFRATNPGLARVGSWGGSALGVAILHAETGPAPLVLAVGSAVSRQLPTAARLAVLSRAPLTGRFAEGHLGGDLGQNLATLADALVLRGQTRVPGAVLVLGSDGSGRLESRPELLGCSPVEVWRQLGSSGALMSVGLGGELGLPYAVLASGGEHPSFVGRGGLGAVFGGLGLKALVIEAPARDVEPSQRPAGLQQALASSPRLAARSAGGSLELYDQMGDAGLGGRLAREAQASGVERKGCRGCPTPCGWVFERTDGRRQKGHFNANRALGVELGLTHFDDSLALLSRCDRYGLDAREVGALLGLLVRAEARAEQPSLYADVDALLQAIDGLLGKGDSKLGLDFDDFKYGAANLAKRLELPMQAPLLKGHAAPEAQSLAGLLGQAVSCGAADPMRTFPFLVDAMERRGLERICRDLAPLPAGAEDPDSPVAKGRLVAWHENLVAAVDAVGFCVFSTAGLLADGVSDLESIAAWLLPQALREPEDAAWSKLSLDERLLAAGANIVELRRALDRRYRSLDSPEAASSPLFSAAQRQLLDQPGMLDEYLLCRPEIDDSALLAKPRPAARLAAQASPQPEPQSETPRVLGQVQLEASGPLGAALGAGGLRVSLPLPASLSEVFQAACAVQPALARQLFTGPAAARTPLPSAWREGRRLAEGKPVQAGDSLLLISVIAGG
jgi:aldehyde:ferredoxin oxidoreductase